MMVPWIQVNRSRSLLLMVKPSVFLVAMGMGILLHISFLKTLPVMVAVVEQLGGALGESGLLVLPCIAAHFNQVIFDSFLVNFWIRKDTSTNSAMKP
ncbi:hypothetical protein DVH24_006246 [Malus domestica]|uniref:Uncharacterized protein n=1 Tax=Malus domestica TaxID=3750 RepID=A0A498K9N5_MALDO|nr:hypothetical protein DVH24_006246 [Malus domestica]